MRAGGVIVSHCEFVNEIDFSRRRGRGSAPLPTSLRIRFFMNFGGGLDEMSAWNFSVFSWFFRVFVLDFLCCPLQASPPRREGRGSRGQRPRCAAAGRGAPGEGPHVGWGCRCVPSLSLGRLDHGGAGRGKGTGFALEPSCAAVIAPGGGQRRGAPTPCRAADARATLADPAVGHSWVRGRQGPVWRGPVPVEG